LEYQLRTISAAVSFVAQSERQAGAPRQRADERHELRFRKLAYFIRARGKGLHISPFHADKLCIELKPTINL